MREKGFFNSVLKQFTKGKLLHVIYVPEEVLTILFSIKVMMSYVPIIIPSY